VLGIALLLWTSSGGTLERPAVAGDSNALAIMLTGDGGWRRIDAKVTDPLRRQGIPVVGLLTNVYFAQRRTPEEAAAELAQLIREHGRRWNKSKVILIGYSRGADVLPFLVNRLPPDLKARISLIAFLGLEPTIDFKYHPSWNPFLRVREPQFPVLPEVEKLRGLPLLCVEGTKEKDSLCRVLPPGLATTLRLPGGHHFGGRYDDIAKTILTAANTRQ
jgi:type IV secretory pathway VirJ component